MDPLQVLLGHGGGQDTGYCGEGGSSQSPEYLLQPGVVSGCRQHAHGPPVMPRPLVLVQGGHQ